MWIAIALVVMWMMHVHLLNVKILMDSLISLVHFLWYLTVVWSGILMFWQWQQVSMFYKHGSLCQLMVWWLKGKYIYVYILYIHEVIFIQHSCFKGCPMKMSDTLWTNTVLLLFWLKCSIFCSRPIIAEKLFGLREQWRIWKTNSCVKYQIWDHGMCA